METNTHFKNIIRELKIPYCIGQKPAVCCRYPYSEPIVVVAAFQCLLLAWLHPSSLSLPIDCYQLTGIKALLGL